MNTLAQDVIYGIRMLTKKPSFTVIAVLSLALGIGVNTAIFTLVNAILLGSLPYPEANRVVTILTVPPQHPEETDAVSVPDFMAWKERNQSFEAVGVMTRTRRDFGAEEDGVPAERLIGEDFTPEVMEALHVQPLMGRSFQASDDEVDNPAPVIILSYRTWQTRFGGDTEILNRTVLVNGVKTNIIGVMGPDFRVSDENAAYWAPMRFNRFQLRGSARFMFAVARLKRGVSMQQAQADMNGVAARLAQEIPNLDMDHGKPWGVRIQTLREGLFGFMSRPLLLLQGAVAFVLLIACANVAALLLARATSRHNEIAIRSALGAGRWRIVRQFLTESVLLSLLGGMLGVSIAWWGVRALVIMAPEFFPRLQETVIDRRVLWFSAALSVLTGLLFGAGPAIRGSNTKFISGLKDSVRGGTSGRSRNRLRGALVTVQIAMALMLLIGAGLLIRSFMRMQSGNLGCDPRGLLTFRVTLPEKQFGRPTATYKGIPLWTISSVPADMFTRIYEQTQKLPGVQSGAGSVYPPLSGAETVSFAIEGRPSGDADALSAEYNLITPNYFNTLKIPMSRGRDFNARDTVNSPWVAIVNETMARRFWPNEDPIGKRLTLDLSPDEMPREVIAVVRDTPSTRLQTKQEAALYVPFVQMPPNIIGPYTGFRLQLTFVYRTAGQPLAMVPALRKVVNEIAPNRPLVDIKTVEQYLSQQIQYPRYYSMLLGLFAAIATVLAAVGIYGVMAYAVAQRTREIGIRMALGARTGDVLRLVIGHALLLIGAGLILGLGGAMALTRYLSSELWEVTSTDPLTFGLVSIALILVAVVACLLPTRRAIRVDPTIALRYE